MNFVDGAELSEGLLKRKKTFPWPYLDSECSLGKLMHGPVNWLKRPIFNPIGLSNWLLVKSF